jgi:RNA-directed DNA polymerase
MRGTGPADEVVRKLAEKFNVLATGPKIRIELNGEEIAKAATWVLETQKAADGNPSQATAFFLKDVGLVTCAHCAGAGMTIWHPSNPANQIAVTTEKVDTHRDLAVLNVPSAVSMTQRLPARTTSLPDHQEIILIGYPNHTVWNPVRAEGGTKLRAFSNSGVTYIEITAKIIEGNSGGPIVDKDYSVVGIAARGINIGTSIQHAEYFGVDVREIQNL